MPFTGQTSQAVYGAGTAVIGDSIAAGAQDGEANIYGVHGNNWFHYLCLASAGKIQHVWNAGIGGQTTAQIVPRIVTDILPKKPTRCVLQMGTNDTDPLNQTLPNFTTAIQTLLAAGIQPILVTIPPAGTAAISAPVATATASTTGGTLAAGTYGYRVAATNDVTNGVTLASVEVTVTTTGSTGSVTLTWAAVPGATGYKVYGRTPGAELLIAIITQGGSVPTMGYVDTGAAAPAGALPSSNTTASALTTLVRTKITGVNNVITRLAQRYGLPLVDMYSFLVDPSTGMYKTGWTKEGTHPSVMATKLMGQYAASVLAPYYTPSAVYLAGDNADPTCIVSNPLLLTNNGVVPQSWSAYGGSGTAESITTDSSVEGAVLQISRADFTPRYVSAPTLTTGWSVGDKIAISGRISLTGADANGGLGTFGMECNGSGNPLTWIGQMSLCSDTPGGFCTFYFEGIIPPGTTNLEWSASLAYGPITMKLGQLTARNLTAEGIA
ncbi:MAG: GDSL-type esterase/lipase family protein [Janthinobacterium lividum]